MPDRAPPSAAADAEPSEVPPDHSQPLARTALASRKRRDAAIVLPLVAIVLYASPLLETVAVAGTIAGIPVSVLYIFGTWFALIWITARLSRRLLRDAGEG